MIDKINYPFRIWMTSILVGPLLHVTLTYIFNEKNYTIFNGINPMVYILYVIFGCLFSFPAFFVLWLSYTLLAKSTISQTSIKTILAFICPICTTLTIIAIPLPEKPAMLDSEFILMVGAYIPPLIFGVLFFKLDTSLPINSPNKPSHL